MIVRNIQQINMFDCGPCCVVELFKRNGINVDLQKIREVSETDSMGTTGMGIIKVLNQYGFKAKGVRIENIKELSNKNNQIITCIEKEKKRLFTLCSY